MAAESLDSLDYSDVLSDLKKSFDSGISRDLEWRKAQLRAMHRMFLENHEQITAAIQADLGGPKFRGLIENTTISSFTHCLKNIDAWTAPERVTHPSMLGNSLVRKEPKGVTLLIAPWNYPINLVFKPLAYIVAAGNCCVIKPSEMSANCSRLIAGLVRQYLDPACFRVIEGAVRETTALLHLRWDHIIYTGNGAVAKIVMAAAAKHLIPCTLELGGKSPVIIDETAKIDLAVARVAFGKWTNVGQTCVAPDYILVHQSVKKEFTDKLASKLKKMFGANPQGSKDYGRIIHPRHVDRIRRLLDDTSGSVTAIGTAGSDAADRYVPPTIVADPLLDDAIMREEIFGPVLPVQSFSNIDEAIAKLRQICEHPLALYIFSENTANIDAILDGTTSGGVGVNCVLEHLTDHLPFGGVGESGMGSYGGKWGFDEFSHSRAVMYKDTRFSGAGVLLPPYSPAVYKWGTRYLVTGLLTDAQKGALKAIATAAAVAIGGTILRSRL